MGTKKLIVWAAFAMFALAVIAVVASFMRAEYRAKHFGKEITEAGERARAEFGDEFDAMVAAPDKTVRVRVLHSRQPDAGSVVLLFPVGIKKTMPSRGLAPAVAELELETVRESWRAVGGDLGVTDGEGMATFTNLSGGKYRLIAISKNGNVHSTDNDINENVKLLELYLDDARLALEYAISHNEIQVFLQGDMMPPDMPRTVFIR